MLSLRFGNYRGCKKIFLFVEQWFCGGMAQVVELFVFYTLVKPDCTGSTPMFPTNLGLYG